jgi:hypothetical protein
MKRIYAIAFLIFLFAGAGVFASVQEDDATYIDQQEKHKNTTENDKNQPIIGNITLDPLLSITNFAPYTINADINPNGANITKVTVFITPQNGDASQENWDFYVNGDPDPSPNSTFSYTMTLNNGGKGKNTYDEVRSSTVTYSYNRLLPDDIYPEIFFADFEITAIDDTETQNSEIIFRNRYALLNYTNTFTINSGDDSGQGTSLFIEFYTAPNQLQAPRATDMEVYVVGEGHTIASFEEDGTFANQAWQNHPEVALVGTISWDDDYHHQHGPPDEVAKSKHHLVPLLTDNEGKIQGVDINDNFWIILYTSAPPAQEVRRGWLLKQYNLSPKTHSNYYLGSGTSFALQGNSFPDAHVHIVRNNATQNTKDDLHRDDSIKNRTTITDGVMLEIEVEYDSGEESVTKEQFLWHGPIDNLAPNASSFVRPEPDAYTGVVTITWNPATDPNNNPITYNVVVVTANVDDDEEFEPVDVVTLTTSISDTEFAYNKADIELPDGEYNIRVDACDNAVPSLCTPFFWYNSLGFRDPDDPELSELFETYNPTVWQGGAAEETNWDESDNWNNFAPGVYTFTKQVVIPQVTSFPVISGTSSVIRSLHVEDEAELTIAKDGFLTVEGGIVTNTTGTITI